MPKLRRYVTGVLFLFCFGVFSCSALSPMWTQLTHVDVDGWPLNTPHPPCPNCNTVGSIVLDTESGQARFHCNLCHNEFWAEMPKK